MPDELWTEVRDIVQEAGNKTIPKEKKRKKAKWLSEEALQIVVNRRDMKGTGENSTHGHDQIFNTKIRLITFFAAKYRDVLYCQQKQNGS